MMAEGIIKKLGHSTDRTIRGTGKDSQKFSRSFALGLRN